MFYRTNTIQSCARLKESIFLNKTPVVTQWDIDWMDCKLRMMDTPLSKELYKMATFGGKQIKTMSTVISGKYAANGHCLIDVFVFKAPGENEDIFQYSIKAMIDTGATFTVISGRMADKLQLIGRDSKSTIRGFNPTGMEKCTEVYISIPALWGENSVFADKCPIKEKMENIDHPELSFDIVIGADIMNRMKFERNGPNGTFTLSI